MKLKLPILGIALLSVSSLAQTNVIFVTIDDLNKDSLAIHGCPIPDITPNLDALGNAGLRFEHAHVAAANCTPSRNVMMSGMYSHNNKVLSVSNEGSGNHNTFPTMPDIFNAAGYHTGIMGKNGHQQPYEPFAGWDEEYDGYGSTRDPENIYSKLTTAFSDAASAGQPLFFNLNIYDPHVTWYKWDHKLGEPKTAEEVVPSRIYTRDEVPYPSFFPPLSSTEMTNGFASGYNLMDEVAAYYNSVKRTDDSIGRMMDAIADSGATNNTIIIVISDHGVELSGGKTQLYNHSSASPMFVYWPGVTSSNTVNDTQMVNSIDFLPSFCELTGQPIPAGIDGKSFIPMIKGESPTDWRDFIYKEHSVGHNMRAVQTTNMLYIFNPWSDGVRKPSSVTTGHKSHKAIQAAAASGTNAIAAAWLEQFEHRTVEELYDTANDPDCKFNLFTNATYAAELAVLQNLLQQEMLASGDLEILGAFTNRTSQAALDQYMDDDQTMRNEMKATAEHVREVFFNPHDDWEKLDYTIFEPFGNWGIWEAEDNGIALNASDGHDKAGNSCIEFHGSDSDVSRLVVSNAIDTSVFEQLKLDVIFSDSNAFSGGATLAFQYNAGTGWQTFQTISSAGKKNLTFDLSGIGSPAAMLFGIQADFNESGGSIYMDHARLTAWQDWVAVPTNTPFDATHLGHIRLSFDFETQNFSSTDKLLLEAYTGSSWEPVEEYAFDYVLQTNRNYSDIVELTPSNYTFPSNMDFRFRSESTGSGQAFIIDNYTIETRLLSEDVTITIPPTANPDSYSATDPQAIVVPTPGILGNDVSGTGSNLTSVLVTDVANGILEFNPDGSFVYAATNGYTGADAFTYVAYDEGAFSATTTVSLAINVPVAQSTNLLSVTFGATADLAATYNGVNSTVTQGSDIASPSITITGLDIDGIGGNDDQIDVVFSVSASGGSLAILSQGYVLDAGYALSFDITSSSVTLGNGGTNYSISEIGFISTKGNNGARTYTVTSPDSGFTTLTDVAGVQPLTQDAGIDGLSQFTMTSTATANNRARNFIAEFSVTGGTPSSSITNMADWATTHGVSTNGEYTLDYAFNINPHLSKRYPLPMSGNSGLPVWKLSDTENKLIVDFIRRKQAADLTYKTQFTDSLLTNWTDAVSAETIIPIDDEFERVQVADNLTTFHTTNRFGRVTVIQ